MSPEESQIVALFEHSTDPMTVEDITSATGLSATTVKLALMKHSKRYNEINGTPALAARETFNENDNKLVMQALRTLVFSEVPQVALRASRFIYDEIRGRNDSKHTIRNVNINVNMINARLKEIEDAEKRAMAQVIDISPELKPLQLIEQ